MFVGVDPELGDPLGVGRDGDEVLRDAPRRRRARPAPTRGRVRALVIVSSVVNVFEETTNSVSAGSRSRVASAKSVPSTLETKRKRHLAPRVVAQRLVGHHRPEVGAADADVDHVADRLAGVPAPLARRGPARQKRAIRSSTSWTCLTTSTPSTTSERSRGIRSATWSTARSSETLIRSPRNIASRRSASPDSSASSPSSADRLVGDPVLRVVEVEARRRRRPAARRAPGRRRTGRAGGGLAISAWWRSSAAQAGRSRSGATQRATPLTPRAGRASQRHRVEQLLPRA